MSKLSDFFQKLGSDAALLEAYKADPEGVMQDNGLSDEEIAAVMSGDKEQIDSLSGDSSDTQAYLIVTNPDDSN
ncbi:MULTISPECIES: hypothetical protein [Shewanella]|uniref:Extradiol ring-cleavage dioxygenase LigAB LigA subunit domain-containing protein n=1 Tax=Shewanella marisflavi TaxID=260364 RepID=A0ABX5WNY9_9GAMM|nr:MULTISPECIES: hypothetical protein [Shewanella]QDF75979.1 hypothetical protein FGA12_12935 [Shewanella marisflavi]